MGLFDRKKELVTPPQPAACRHEDRETEARRAMGGHRVAVWKCRSCGYVGSGQ